MNVLFVCSQNVGRSQMAAALYNVLATDGHADAAGIRVGDAEGQTLGERAKESEGAQDVLTAMEDLRVDLSHEKRKQLHKEQLADYDLVVVMSEPEIIPDWLEKADNAVYWDIPDPRFSGLDATRVARDAIKRDVVALLQTKG